MANTSRTVVKRVRQRRPRRTREPQPPTARPVRLAPNLYLAQAQPGFESTVWSEISTRIDGAREHSRRTIPDRAGITIFSAPRPDRLRTLRTAEDVFALAGARSGLASDASALDKIRAAARGAPYVAEAIEQRVRFTLGVRAGRRLRFRVVARAVGEHEFRRVDFQRAVERGVLERGDHTWRLDENAADVEFWAMLIGGEFLLSVRLSDDTMRHRDYKVAHRPGSLRPAAAAALAWLSAPSPDDVVLDPFCGAATILIERAHLGRYQQLLGSDRDSSALRAARENVGSRYQPIQLESWDAGALPLADGSVTKIVTNLPWGERHGSHGENRRLYPDWIAELNRVLAPDGRMVLLTSEWRLMHQLIDRRALTVSSVLRVTILGADASIYVCRKA